MNKYYKLTHGATTHYCCEMHGLNGVAETVAIVTDYGNGRYGRSAPLKSQIDALYPDGEKQNSSEVEYNNALRRAAL